MSALAIPIIEMNIQKKISATMLKSFAAFDKSKEIFKTPFMQLKFLLKKKH